MGGCDFEKKSFRVFMRSDEPKNRKLGKDSKVISFGCDTCKNHLTDVCGSCTRREHYERVEDETT